MILGVPKETLLGERRVSVIPDAIPKLTGVSVIVERGAGESAGFTDASYLEKGGKIEEDSKSLFGGADIILKVQPPSVGEAGLLKEGSSIISFLYPLANLEVVKKLSERKATAFAMELIPRISRAQPMDALSSQSNLAGYKAVLIAADTLPRIFP